MIKKIFIAFLVAICLIFSFADFGYSRTVYQKYALTGGTSDAVDGINGSLLSDGDFCFAMADGSFYVYVLDADSGVAEASPYVLKPDTNSGNKRWILQTITAAAIPADLPTTSATIAGGVLTLDAGSQSCTVDTEGGAALDSLDRVVGLTEGQMLILNTANSGRVVQVVQGPYMKLAKGRTFIHNEITDSIFLRFSAGGICREITRSSNEG